MAAAEESKVPVFNLPINEKRFATLAEATKVNRLADAYLFTLSQRKPKSDGKENADEEPDLAATMAQLVREARLQNQLGAAMIQASRFDKAEKLLAQALQKFETFEAMLKEKKLGDLSQGEQMLLQHKFGFSNLLYHMGSALASQKRSSEAASYYIRAIARSPFAHVVDFSALPPPTSSLLKASPLKFNSPAALAQTYTNFGVMLMMLEKDIAHKDTETAALLSTAEESFARAIQLDPGNSECHINLGNLLRQLGRREQAIAHVWAQIGAQFKRNNPDTTEFHPPAPLLIKPAPPAETPQHIAVVCVKFGTKYGADYVNKLYRGVARNLTIPFTFYCFTEKPEGLDESILPVPLDTSLSGWWAKAHIFKAGSQFEISGRIMYIDLDMIITGSLDELVRYQGQFALLSTEDIFCETAKEEGYNSSIILFPASLGQYLCEVLLLWKEYLLKYIVRFDHFLEMMVKEANFVQKQFPGQVQDYTFMKQQQGGGKEGEGSALAPGTRVVAFPRSPKPHEVMGDAWVKEHWV